MSTGEERRQDLRGAVAVRIMSWRSERIPWAYDGEASVWHDRGGAPLVPEQAWRPDEDHAQCMTVLARMRELGFAFELRSLGDAVRAVFRHDSGAHGEAEHDDLRRALLGAALAAAGSR